MSRESGGQSVAWDTASTTGLASDRAANDTAARNTVALVLARFIGAVAATAVLAFSAHRLTVEDFGIVASVLAGGMVANALVTFGTDTVVTRAVARGGGAEARSSLVLQLGVSVVLVLIAGVGVVGLSWPGAVLVQAVVLFPLAVVTVTGAVLRGQRMMRSLAVAAAVGGLVSVAAVVIAHEFASGPAPTIAALGLGATAAAALQSLAVVRSGFLVQFSAPPPAVTALLRRSAPFATMIVLAAVGTQGGLLMLEAMSDTPTGGYGAALRVLEAGRLVPASAMAAWFPTLAEAQGARGEHGQVSPEHRRPQSPGAGVSRTLDYRAWRWGLVAFSIAAALAVILLAPVIDRFVFDAQPDGVALLRVLAISLPLTTVRLARSTEAIAADRERLVLASAVVGAAVLVGGGVLVSRPWGAVGVAGAQVAGVAVAAAILLAFGPSSVAPGPADASAAASTGIGSGEGHRGNR